MFHRIVTFALALAIGCSAGAVMPTVTMTSAGERPGPPPLIRLLVDVTIANPGADRRWVLIQRNVPETGTGRGGVDTLEQLTAPGGVAIGRFLGTGGFYGVALAPGARLTMKNLEIEWWNSNGARTPPAIEVTTATGVTLGGEDIAGWYDGDPVVSGTIEIDADKAEHTHSRRAEGGREVTVTAADAHREHIPVK